MAFDPFSDGQAVEEQPVAPTVKTQPSESAAFDPFASGQAVEEPFDPFASGQAVEEPQSSAVGDFATRVAQSAVRGFGHMVGGISHGLEKLEEGYQGTFGITPEAKQAALTKMGYKPATPEALAKVEQQNDIVSLADEYHPDPARADSNASIVADAIGGVAPIVLTGPLSPVAMAAQIGEGERQGSLAAGERQDLANARFNLGFSIGVPTALLGPWARKSAGIIERVVSKAATGTAAGYAGAAILDKAQDRQINQRGAAVNAGMMAILGALHSLRGEQRSQAVDQLKQTDEFKGFKGSDSELLDAAGEKLLAESGMSPEEAAAFGGTPPADQAAVVTPEVTSPAAATPLQRQIAAAAGIPDVEIPGLVRQRQLNQALNAGDWYPGGERRADVVSDKAAAADPAGALKEQLAAEAAAADPSAYRTWWDGVMADAERIRQSAAGSEALKSDLRQEMGSSLENSIKANQLAGPEVRPAGGVDFARRSSDAPANENQADTSDSFAGVRSDITGSRVSPAQAVRIAERVRSLALRAAEPNTGGAQGVGQEQLARTGIVWSGRSLRGANSVELARSGGGAEAHVYADRKSGVIYKVFGKGSSGSIGQRFVFEGGELYRDTGRSSDVVEKAWVMNELGGTPTEVLGKTSAGEVVTKQPLGSTEKTWDENAVNARARLVEIPANVLKRPEGAGSVYLAHINGQDVIVGDLHAGNYIADTLAKGRIADLVTHRLTAAELERLPELKQWVEQNRGRAAAPGAAEFSQRSLAPLPEGSRIEPLGERELVLKDSGSPIKQWQLRMPGEGRGRTVTKESLAAEGWQAPDFANRTPEEAAAIREVLAQRQAKWIENARKVAPGVMAKFSLEFGDPKRIVEMGRARFRDLTGYEEAAYLSKEKMFFLFDQALANRSDAGTTLNLIHEMGHAFHDTLPPERSVELMKLWQKEITDKSGPLFGKDGKLRRGVAMGVETNFKEWFAERLAWSNREWARRRIGVPLVSDGLMGKVAQQFRQLLEKLGNYWEQLRGEKLNVDFRKWLDQGDRFDAGAETAAPAYASRTGNLAKTESTIIDTTEKARKWVVRNFTSAGGLPKGVLEMKLAKDAKLSAISKASEFALRDFDRAVHAVYGGCRAMTGKQLALVNDVLGGRTSATALDPRLRGPVGAMRSHIDVLSRRLVQEGVVDGDLAARIDGNVGFYLHRSYAKFDDPAWSQHVPEAAVNRAKSFIAAELQAQHPNVPVEAREVQGYVDYLLSKDVSGPETLYRGGKEGSMDLSVFKARKDIPEPIRTLLGEYTDPRVNYVRSIAKTAQVLESHRFLQQVRAAGEGKWLFDRPISDESGSYTVPIAAKGSKAMEPLAGLYTTEDVAKAFQNQFSAADDVWRWWLRVNGWAKTAKTVLSPMTQARNFAGNLGFLIANGHWRTDAAGDVWKALKADFGWGDTLARREYLLRLQRLGIVGESISSGELKEAIHDAGVKMRGFEGWADGRMAKAAKAPFAAAARLYQVNDEVFKIFAFENERRAWAAANPKLTAAQLDAIAAERVRNTLPTYSLIPRGIRAVRRYALTGSFLSFPSEIVRTLYHTIGYMAADLKSANPKIRAIGAKRLAGLALVATLPAGASMLSRWFSNLDSKDEDNLRRFLPEWNQNAALYYQANDGHGRFKLTDASYLDPWNYVKKPLTAALRGEDWVAAVRDAGVEALSPFAGEGLVTKTTLDLARNRDDQGRPIWNTAAPALDKALAGVGHAWDLFEPGIITQGRRIVNAARGKVSESGRAYDLGNEISAVVTGARSQSLDVGQALGSKAKRFAGETSGAELIYTSVRDRKGEVTPKELSRAKQTMEMQRAGLHAEFVKDVQAAQELGVSLGDVLLALKAANLGNTDIAAILGKQYIPYIDRGPGRARIYDKVLRQQRTN